MTRADNRDSTLHVVRTGPGLGHLGLFTFRCQNSDQEYLVSQMLRRAFTAQHMLQDAEQEFADAIYRFREAERDISPDYDAARCAMNGCAMNDAEGKVATIRQFIYSGNPFKIWEQQVPSQQFDRCPVPAWI